MSWSRVGGSGPPLQTLVVLWRGGKLWQAGASYLNGIRPTVTVSSLNTLAATSCSSLKPSSAWGGCRLFWGVDVFLEGVGFWGVYTLGGCRLLGGVDFFVGEGWAAETEDDSHSKTELTSHMWQS